MRRSLVTAVIVMGALAGAHESAAGVATLSMQEITLNGGRGLATVVRDQGFDYLGLHWKGTGKVSYRVLGEDGRWSAWVRAGRDAGPDSSASETTRARGWVTGEGVWVGRSTRLEVRADSTLSRVRAYTVRSPVSRVPARRQTSVEEPSVVSRQGWQADETLRRDTPQTAATLRFAVVHHTAGTNEYRREDGPAIVRAIQLYHVKANGWSDIGYNALVDRFGIVYEGRWGGLGENIVGAHARGFNTGSFGIAVMGEFTTTAPPAVAREALARTIAWRLDRAHVDPLSTLDAIAGGNERFPPGILVPLRAVSGHRDTGLTVCPGQRLSDLLPAVAARAAAIGLPKLYEPVMTGTPGGPLTFTARLSAPLAWVFTATGTTGETVFETSGAGKPVVVTWDTSGLEPGAYRWRLDAPGVRPAEGMFDTAGTSAALTVTATADPGVIAPDGDGTLDTTTLTYSLSAPANVGVTVHDPVGTQLAVLETPRWHRSGPSTLSFDGLGLPAGVVELRLLATATGGRTASAAVPVAITRTLGRVSLERPVLSPNGDGHDDLLTVRFSLSGPASVRLRILREGRWTATPFSATPLSNGAQVIEWDGSKRVGKLREGAYAAVLEATDTIATARVSLPFVADWTPPKVSVVSLDPLLLRVSEPATLRIRADGLRRRVRVAGRGLVRVAAIRRPRLLVVIAADDAGNQSEPLRRPAD